MTVRHFTATGFVVHDDHTLLHWHPKVRAWLPPGGHVAENEDPVQAVLREVLEETGLLTEIVESAPPIDLAYPRQVAPPLTIMVEEIDDPVAGPHQHIDMIYVCRLAGLAGPLHDGWSWVGRRTLAAGAPLTRADGQAIAPPEDVRVLAALAFALADQAADRR